MFNQPLRFVENVISVLSKIGLRGVKKLEVTTTYRKGEGKMPQIQIIINTQGKYNKKINKDPGYQDLGLNFSRGLDSIIFLCIFKNLHCIFSIAI